MLYHKGEILALTWNDVNLKQKMILVRTSKNGEKREIPVAEHVLGILLGLPKESGKVFDFGDRNPIETIRRGFRAALEKVGIENFRFHDLRHTLASHLVMNAVDLLTVKELMGHKSINMTLRYAHLNPDHKRKAIESLKFFDGHFLDTKQAV